MPLYYQLFLRVRNDIQTGLVRPGDRLGTEEDIQQRFDVSRATVRRALDELARSGHIERITGRGTFITDPGLAVHAPHLLSLTEELNRRGVTPGTELLAFERVPAPPAAEAALGTRRGELVLHIRRLRTGNEEPIILVDHFLSPVVSIAEQDLQQSLYATLEGTMGVRLHEAFHTVTAGASTREEASLLGLNPGEPVLRFERTTLTVHERPLLYEVGSARPDRYGYSVHLFRE